MNPAADTIYIEATRKWLEKVVLGLNLCPFAKRPYTRETIRYVVLISESPSDLSEMLEVELTFLAESDPEELETTLLIHPNCLLDFNDYNDYLEDADQLLVDLELEGEIQIASFHPQYQFADTEPEDPENYTNRSPYPMLHLLREDSISWAVDTFPEAENIPEQNIAMMNKLGIEKIKALLKQGE
jgi:hypothetical protein